MSTKQTSANDNKFKKKINGNNSKSNGKGRQNNQNGTKYIKKTQNGRNSPKPSFQSTSLFIGKVFFRDLEGYLYFYI